MTTKSVVFHFSFLHENGPNCVVKVHISSLTELPDANQKMNATASALVSVMEKAPLKRDFLSESGGS